MNEMSRPSMEVVSLPDRFLNPYVHSSEVYTRSIKKQNHIIMMEQISGTN
jgi:hypothetical protein